MRRGICVRSRDGGSIIESDYSWLNCAEQTILLFCVTVRSSDKGREAALGAGQGPGFLWFWSRIIISDLRWHTGPDSHQHHQSWPIIQRSCKSQQRICWFMRSIIKSRLIDKQQSQSMWPVSCVSSVPLWSGEAAQCSVTAPAHSDYSGNKYLAYRGKNCADQTVASPGPLIMLPACLW